MIGITGINGFVGGCLYNFFEELQYDMVGLSTNPQKFRTIKLVDGVPTENIEGISSIIHCGGLVGNGFEKKDYLYANVVCTENLIRWCEKKQVKHFVLFSTGGVYGEHQEWVDENAHINPTGYYSESKFLAEEKLLQSSLQLKTIIRLYFPMGNFQYKHLFSKIANNLYYKREVYLNDEQGHPCISPVFMKDICYIISQVINKKTSGVYNLSANIGITIGEIVDIMADLYGFVPKKYIKNCSCGNYLGKADKLIHSIGYRNFTTPKDALHYIVKNSTTG